jgi:hypothetical protein
MGTVEQDLAYQDWRRSRQSQEERHIAAKAESQLYWDLKEDEHAQKILREGLLPLSDMFNKLYESAEVEHCPDEIDVKCSVFWDEVYEDLCSEEDDSY